LLSAPGYNSHVAVIGLEFLPLEYEHVQKTCACLPFPACFHLFSCLITLDLSLQGFAALVSSLSHWLFVFALLARIHSRDRNHNEADFHQMFRD